MAMRGGDGNGRNQGSKKGGTYQSKLRPWPSQRVLQARLDFEGGQVWHSLWA